MVLDFLLFDSCSNSVSCKYHVRGSGINLGSRFKGLTEFSAMSRDSGALKLWNLSLLFSLLGWTAITYSGGMPVEGLF